MSNTYSTMLALGTKAPNFNLINTNDKNISLDDVKKENGILVMFICNHCPFVIHYKKIFSTLYATCDKYNIGMVAINSNDAENYPQDSFTKMKEDSINFGYQFEYLYDEDQQVAKDYKAACTPDIYLFDYEYKLRYRGQIDGSRPTNDEKVRGRDLLDAIKLVGERKKITTNQISSMGCNIKWKQGNEPKYFTPKNKK
jgi:peroxiredoxin